MKKKPEHNVKGKKAIRNCKSGVDVTEREKAEKQLQDMAKFPEENPFPVLRISENGRILYSNKPGELLLESWKKAVGQTAPARWRKLVADVLKSGQMRVEEVSLESRIFSFVLAPIAESGPVSPLKGGRGLAKGGYVNLYGRDVTETREKEEKLRQQAQILDQVHDAVIITDLDGFVTSWNKGAENQLGFTAEEAFGKHISFLYPLEERGSLKKEIFEPLMKKGFLELETRAIKKTGEYGYAHLCLSLIKNKEGVATGAVGYATDITEYKRMEEVLHKSREDLTHAQAVAHTGSWRMDVQRNELTWSDEAYNIFGIPKGTPLTYETFLDCVHSEDRKYVNMKWREALRGKGYDIEHRIVVDGPTAPRRGEAGEVSPLRGGQIKWVRERAELEFDKYGTLLGGFGTVTDITGRKQTEEALRQAKGELEKRVAKRTAELTQTVQMLAKTEKTLNAERKRFENVLEIMPAYAVLLTPDYHVAYANRFFEERFGEDKGRHCYEYLFNRTSPCEICETYKVLKTKKPHRWEWTGPDGRIYDIYDYPFTDADGSPLIMEIGVDITEHKRAQEQLRSASIYARGLLESSLDPLVTISADGKITDVNEATIKVTGLSRNELIGTDFLDYFTEPEKAKEGYQEVFIKGFVTDYPLTIKHRDGRQTDVLYNAVVYKNEAGEAQGVFAAARDVTERKHAESRQSVTNSLLELYAREESRKAYLDSAVKVIRNWSRCEFVGIRIRDDEGNIPYESHIGFDDNFLALESALHLERDKCVCIRAILEKPRRGEKKFITNGGSFYINDSEAFLKGLAKNELKEYRGNCIKWGFKSISVVPFRYRDKVVGAIHLADLQKDKVTLPKIQFIETTIAPLIGEAVQRFNAEAELEEYRQHLEDQVKQRTEELARSNRDLEQFAYVASHDLQEPLRSVAGFVGLLRTQLLGTLDAKKLEYMNFATDGVTRMQALISGLLEYSRVGTREKECEMTDSKEAVGHAIAHLGGGIKEFGVKITIADNLPKVYVDSIQLSQLFQNLVGNAIKFCNKESPQVHINATREDSAWRFAVADNGIGIEPQYAERIFQIFQRLHSRDKYPGTGIGLAICKKIVERHGGKIWVKSKHGAGSTFYFTIPDREDT